MMSKSRGNYFRSKRLIELIIVSHTVGHYYAQLNASFLVKIETLIPLHMFHAEILIYSSLGFLYCLYMGSWIRAVQSKRSTTHMHTLHVLTELIAYLSY